MNPYNHYDETETKRCQVVYLSAIKNLEPEQICKYVDYALRTVKIYIRKYMDELLQKAVELFAQADTVITSKVEDLKDDVKEKCYLFKFYTDEGILFTKVGTTKRTIMTRLNEELRTYKKSGFRITEVVIEAVVDCGLIPAEGLESFCRAAFIHLYPNNYKKNDRFMRVDVAVEDFNELTKMYLTK